MDDLSKIKKQHNILGKSQKLDQAINIAIQVDPTDLSILVIGESGSGKDVFPKIINQNLGLKILILILLSKSLYKR